MFRSGCGLDQPLLLNSTTRGNSMSFFIAAVFSGHGSLSYVAVHVFYISTLYLFLTLLSTTAKRKFIRILMCSCSTVSNIKLVRNIKI